MSGLPQAEEVLAAARNLSWRIATAESCTGGLLAAALTEVPGSSDVLECGYVTYSNQAKQSMLSVQEITLARFGAVSEPVARELAEGALAHSRADITLSITGIAGPGGSEHKAEGMVCFGLAIRGRETASETCQFGPIGRSNVRENSVAHALALLLKACRN